MSYSQNNNCTYQVPNGHTSLEQIAQQTGLTVSQLKQYNSQAASYGNHSSFHRGATINTCPPDQMMGQQGGQSQMMGQQGGQSQMMGLQPQMMGLQPQMMGQQGGQSQMMGQQGGQSQMMGQQNTLGAQLANQAQAATSNFQSMTSTDLSQAQNISQSSCQTMLSKIMNLLGNKKSAGQTLSVSVGPIHLIGGVNDWYVTFHSNDIKLLEQIQSDISSQGISGTLNQQANTLSYPIDKLYKFAVDAEYCVNNYGHFNASF